MAHEPFLPSVSYICTGATAADAKGHPMMRRAQLWNHAQPLVHIQDGWSPSTRSSSSCLEAGWYGDVMRSRGLPSRGKIPGEKLGGSAPAGCIPDQAPALTAYSQPVTRQVDARVSLRATRRTGR